MNDEQYRDLIERAHLIRELQETDGWHVWAAHVKRRLEAKKREMLKGKDSLEEYRYTAGWIEGAEYVIDAVGELDRMADRERQRRKDPVAA